MTVNDLTGETDGLSPTGAEQPSLLDRPLTELIRFNWETIAWAVLLLVAAVARFYALGVRAMSHDESLHALYSYYLYDAGNYQHNPMMHGPFLFHVNTLIYFLFGVTDATARIAPALAGTAVVGMAWFYRPYLGRLGAFLAGIMLTISPSLLFHSRYIRNDIYIALFVLIWSYAAFRYLDARPAHRTRWVTLVVLAMALGFITKEVQFMAGAIIGAFFGALALWQVIGIGLFVGIAPLVVAGGLALIVSAEAGGMLQIAILGLGVIVALALFAYFLWRGNWAAFRHNPSADLAVLMLTLVAPFTSPFGHRLLKWDPMAYATTQDILRSAALVAIVTTISVALAFYWFRMRKQPDSIANAEVNGKIDESKQNAALGSSATTQASLTFGLWGRMMAFFWTIQVLFFTTFLTNTRDGLATGVVGSLGYWLAQQKVQRGSQPTYYYFLLGGLYEFLPIVLSLAGIATVLYWIARDRHWDPVPAVDRVVPKSSGDDDNARFYGADVLAANRLYFAVYCIWWIVGSWAAYTYAGEKMPWLLTHIALPMCIFGGWWLGRLIRRVDWPAARQSHAVWLIGVTPALIFAVVTLFSGSPSLDRTLSGLSDAMQWLVALLVLASLVYLVIVWSKAVGWIAAARLLGLGFVALLFLFTVRFSFMLNYINFDLVTEYLVYAHGSPTIKRALNEIDLISERTVGGRNIVVAYDDDSSWPLSWYMRLYPNSKFYGENPSSDSMSAPIIIVGPKNYDKVHPYVARDYVKRTYQLVWWPDQGYFGLTLGQIWDVLRDPERLNRIFQIVFYRRFYDDEDPNKPRDLSKWPNRHDFEMYVRRDIAADIWDLGVAPLADGAGSTTSVAPEKEIDLAAFAVYSGDYDGLPFSTPRAIAAGVDGARIVADTGNHRIVILDVDGNFVRAFGSHCRLNEGAAGGCVDPDGSGPLALGDGQFYEPWGVAIDDQGRIYVADTWNGRIQVFDAEGRFVRTWGLFNSTNGELGDPNLMFGPRGLAIALDGNLLVADTGNKRILKFTPEGEFLQQIGGGGVIPGHFEEPVDVAVHPVDGSIYVSDSWNRRIQKFDANFVFQAEWPVPGWQSQEIFHKPYLAVASNGDVYATDPEFYRILVFNVTGDHAPAGEIKASFGDYGVDTNQVGLPNGIAIDPLTGAVLVADAGNNRVMAFPPLQ